MSRDHVKLESREAVRIVRLDWPEKLNSLTFDSYQALIDTFKALADEPAARAVVLTGTGKGFCSGGSVTEIIAPLLAQTPEQRYRFTRMTCELIGAIRALPKPVLAAVNGVAVGAGAMLALASDMRWFAESARIAFLFVKVGLSGADMGAAWLLPRVVGLGHASDLLMTGRMVSAEEAARIGLANRVLPDSELLEQALGYARKLAEGPPFGLAMTKRMLNHEAALSLEAALEAEAQAQSLCMESKEFQEGYQAFMDKRPPRFEV